MYHKKLLLFLLLLTGVWLPTDGQAQKRKYRIKTVNGTPFLLAPKTKIGKEGLFGRRTSLTHHRRFRYQRLIFTRLGHSYNGNTNRVNEAVYEFEKRPIQAEVLRINYNIRRRLSDTTIPHCEINYSPDSSSILVELDFDSILKNGRDADAVYEYFATIFAPNLIRVLAPCEAQNRQLPWAKGTMQLILEKTFDRLPLPQSLALHRFGFVSNTDFVFLLLQPKLLLQVDQADMIRSASNWEFNLARTMLLGFYRDDKGELIQLPYLDFPLKVMPDNRVDATILLASTGDIQLSEGTRYKDYIAFYQDYLKYNNSRSSQPDFPQTHGDSLIATALIWHFTTAGEAVCGFTNCDDNKTLSSFGKRNLARPGFLIYLNQAPIFVPFGTTLSQLQQHHPGAFPREWYRYDGNGYPTLTNYSDKTFLLPGDRLNVF